MISRLKPEDLNCNIFSVCDYDAKSLNELLCIFFEKINNCIDVSNATLELAKWLVNEGLAIEVAKQLEIWLADGTLADIINETIFKELNDKINANTSLINEKHRGFATVSPTMTNAKINEILADEQYSHIYFLKGDYHVNEAQTIKVTGYNKMVYMGGSRIVQDTPNSGKYVMLEIRHCTNVNVYAPTIDGLMPENCQATEWGYGIEVTSSRDTTVHQPIIYRTTGDGIYLGYKWEEQNPPKIRQENVKILNPTIKKCSRNGISVCSGDGVYIHEPVIDDVKRKFPMSGIDIEPENSNKAIIHLKDVFITNPKTKTHDVGIIISSDLDTDANININGHVAEDCYVPLYMAGIKRGTVNYKNAIHDKPRYNAIKFSRCLLGATINIDDVLVNGRGEAGAESVPVNSCMICFNNESQEIGGNITISNVVYNKTTQFENIFSVYAQGTKYQNVKLKNILGDNNMPTMRIGTLENPTIINCPTRYESNYGTLNYNSNNCPSNGMIASNLQADTVRVYQADLPDGIYEVGAYATSGFMLTVKFEGLGVIGEAVSQYKSNNDGSYLKFKKEGNRVLPLEVRKFTATL